jgi:hypothetical protein
MKIMSQLAVFVANRPGNLARICSQLSNNGINILGLSVADSVEHAVLRFVVDKPAAAIHVLGNQGLLVLDTEILSIRLDNRPGVMSELGGRLSDLGVNIEYAYGGVGLDDGTGTLFMKVSDVDLARGVLEEMDL